MPLGQLKNKASSFFGLIIILLVFILAVTLFGFFYFSQSDSTNTDQGVEFWLYRHDQQIIGQENTYFVFIKNQEVRDLENVEVVLNFPPGFILSSSTPECQKVLTQGCLWRLSDIKKGELKEIEIKGQLFSQANQDQFFDGYLNFQLQGFSSEFQKNLSSAVTLKPSLSLNWEIPSKSAMSQELESVIYLENITELMISQIEIMVIWPEDFVVSEAIFSKQELNLDRIEINKKKRQIKWQISELDAGQERELNFSGYFKSATTSQENFVAQAGLVKEKDFFLQLEEEKIIKMDRFGFDLSLTISESTFSWGENIPIKLIYQNNNQEIIKDLVLELKINRDQYVILDPLVQTEWSKQKVLSGDNQEINFDLPIISALEAAKNNYSQAELTIQVLARGQLLSKIKEWEVQSNLKEIKIKTNLKLEVSARYYDDERAIIGQGPLPPKVGEKTSYWIFWRLKNTTNPVENLSIKTRLPQGVEWSSETKANYGLVLYNENNREVVWQIPQLPIYSGGPYSLVEAGFEVEITPQASQIDLVLPLTETIVLNAEDQFTGDKINQLFDFLSTELKDDPVGQGLGRVIGN